MHQRVGTPSGIYGNTHFRRLPDTRDDSVIRNSGRKRRRKRGSKRITNARTRSAADWKLSRGYIVIRAFSENPTKRHAVVRTDSSSVRTLRDLLFLFFYLISCVQACISRIGRHDTCFTGVEMIPWCGNTYSRHLLALPRGYTQRETDRDRRRAGDRHMQSARVESLDWKARVQCAALSAGWTNRKAKTFLSYPFIDTAT